MSKLYILGINWDLYKKAKTKEDRLYSMQMFDTGPAVEIGGVIEQMRSQNMLVYWYPTRKQRDAQFRFNLTSNL